ncbi:hypothetical protein Dsin_028917 [Dipteronia sinensis]|uniref:MULE transposase domain-containing protein n=1 Tax=Dipteronia sinensis TaxID=43782 RepID=A0AAE0DV05_9ROSI|nr:hypothetical protein Dsin_028917 [Dipteronia sinensis]
MEKLCYSADEFQVKEHCGKMYICAMGLKSSAWLETLVPGLETLVPGLETRVPRSVASPGFTSTEKDQSTPASTNKHAEVEVDDFDSSDTFDTEVESGCDWQASIGGREISTDVLNSSTPSKTTRAWKLRNGTYWHVTFVDKEHTCGDNGNYNVDFHRVSSHVIRELFSRNFTNPGHNTHRKDIISDMRDKHDINLSYNKAYKSKDRALHMVFGDPWKSFKILPAYLHMSKKSYLGTVIKIETDRKNRFANSECSKSWTWFLTQLREVILHPELLMIVLDRHTGISNGMKTIFPYPANGVCAYHLAKN